MKLFEQIETATIAAVSVLVAYVGARFALNGGRVATRKAERERALGIPDHDPTATVVMYRWLGASAVFLGTGGSAAVIGASIGGRAVAVGEDILAVGVVGMALCVGAGWLATRKDRG